MKTKHGVFLGVAALLAAVTVLFAACGGGGGGGGPKVTVPPAGSLPALPADTTAVTASDESWIKGLLSDLGDAFFDDFRYDMEDKVKDAAIAKGDDPDESPFNFTGDIDLSSGVYGMTSGTLTVTIHVEWAETENSAQDSGKFNAEAKTDIVTDNGLTVLKGSTWAEAYIGSGNENGGKFTETMAIGFTVKKDGKSAKIVYSVTETDEENSSGYKYSTKETIRVYGANNELVFEDKIDDSGSGTWDDWDDSGGWDSGEDESAPGGRPSGLLRRSF